MSLRESAITLLRELVEYESVNNPADNQYPDLEIISFVKDSLRHWNPEYKVKLFNEDNYSSIYITSNLNVPMDVLFLGHLDVVPVTSKWDSDPFKLAIMDDKLGFGRGTKDCKGSVVSALIFIKKINLTPKAHSLVDKIGIFLSTDEESGGQYGARKFFEYAKKAAILPKYIINVDGGPKVVYKRRAGFNLRLTTPPLIKESKGTIEERVFDTRVLFDNNRHSAYFVPGVDSHALLLLSKYLHLNSQVKINTISGDWVKGNVIPSQIRVTLLNPYRISNSKHRLSYDENLTKIVRILRTLVLVNISTEESSEFGITVNPNLLSYSAIEGTQLQIDLRAFISPKEKDRIVNAVTKTLGSFTNQIQVDCRGSSGFFYTDISNPLVTISTKIMRDYKLMDDDELPKEQEGASDARYATMYGVPAIDIGPKGGNVHGDNEYIDLESMLQFSAIYEDIILDLLLEKIADE